MHKIYQSLQATDKKKQVHSTDILYWSMKNIMLRLKSEVNSAALIGMSKTRYSNSVFIIVQTADSNRLTNLKGLSI